MTTKKVLLIVFGAVCALIGLGLAVGGAVLTAVTGGDGYFETERSPVSTPAYALVSEAAGAGTGADAPDTGGFDATVRLVVAPDSGKPVFVGVAPPSVVQAYLGGTAYLELRDPEFCPLRFRTSTHEGGAPPGPPGARSGWLRQVSGTGEQELSFDLIGPEYQVVVMNADASQGVQVSLGLGLRVPFLRGVGIGLLVGAAVFLGLGVALIVWGVRAKGRDPVPPAGPWGQQYVPSGPPPPQPGYGYPPGAGYPPEGWQPPPPPPQEGAQR